MSFFDRSFSSSPVLTLPSQSAHQIPFDRPVFPHHQPLQFSHSASWNQRPTPLGVAGRKRSRDEAAVNLDPPEKVVEPPSIKEDEDEWEYGPGMILIKKSSGYVADAGSQSGTWLEEKSAKEEAKKLEDAIIAQEQQSQERPSLRSNKSQRLEMSQTLLQGAAPQLNRSSPTRDIVNPMTTSSDSITTPVVDDFTLHLGIGWNRVSDNEHIQAAARGWARYIENHYPVTDAKILLESRGLQSYLVEANEGFFLFAENLRQGRLVSQNADRALHNLKATPPVFDGPETLEAAETPKPVDTFQDLPVAASASPAVDMDMS